MTLEDSREAQGCVKNWAYGASDFRTRQKKVMAQLCRVPVPDLSQREAGTVTA